MYPVDEIAAFDRTAQAAALSAGRRAQEEGLAAGHIIRQVRVHRVLMPWTGTKRWDGSAETFTFAEFETDQGLVGISEGASDDEEGLAEKVVGKNPFDPAIRADMGLAYWDLAGKIAGQPLGFYLHDLCQVQAPLAERIPLSAYTWYRFADLDGLHEVTYEYYPDPYYTTKLFSPVSGGQINNHTQ